MKAELSHEDLNHLLPWYANGTLSAEELAQVEEHLKSCNECGGELQRLQKVGAAMRGLAEDAPQPEASFARILAAVESWKQPTIPARQGRFAAWFSVLWHPTVPVARCVFAAQFVLIIALVLYAFAPRNPAPEFNTLSGTEETAGGLRVTVNFAPDATVAEINQSLAAAGGKIVSGPSASGMYVVELPIPPNNESAVQAAVDKLRANRAIRFAERQP